MFSCLQILEAFLWFVLITLLNVTLIILTLSVSRLLNLLLRLVAFLLFLNPQCLASISRWITASSSWKRFCLFVCRALSSDRKSGQQECRDRSRIYTLSLHDALPIFFMVRSYYPSECHADYFDFERIEALKPAIEACGISTLSQSPMLGFHKQMDNRIKLLEEILSFRMQGVEFDNGDMYVDGHKAASDVRDEFVSVTEKLMDELAQCYNVLPQLDINNTIDHRPEGDEKWFLENEKTVTQFCRKLAAERPLKDIRDEYNYPKKKGIKDECSRLLEASTMKSRRGFAIQRLMNAMRQAHADGWFIVFDTLTLADDRLEAFYDNPNALRDYFRDIGRMVLAAEGRKANDSHADCYQYFCVPEYGTANGRLHFHAVHFMRTLPTGSVDPNFGRRVRNRRQLNSLQNTWPYGYSMPIAVRYTQDAFSRSGWLWPVDAKGEPLKATSYMAVGFYVAKYVN